MHQNFVLYLFVLHRHVRMWSTFGSEKNRKIKYLAQTAWLKVLLQNFLENDFEHS